MKNQILKFIDPKPKNQTSSNPKQDLIFNESDEDTKNPVNFEEHVALHGGHKKSQTKPASNSDTKTLEDFIEKSTFSIIDDCMTTISQDFRKLMDKEFSSQKTKIS